MFPTVAMACGPGEIAYLAQLREVFEGLGVRPALLGAALRRHVAAAEAVELIEAAGADAVAAWSPPPTRCWRARRDAHPGRARGRARRARAQAALDGLARFGEASRALDASLPQMVESARGKVDFQFARLHEGLAGKARARLDREHPAWRRLRYVLLPGDKLQERRLAVARAGRAPRRRAWPASCATWPPSTRARARGGVHEHAVLEF